MAYAISAPSVSAPSVFAPIAALRNFAAGVRRSWALRAEYDRTYAELNALSRRDLDDIGIARADIADIAYRHVYGK